MTQSDNTLRPIYYGIGASSGLVRGRARLLHSLESIDDCTSSDVVVVRHATPQLYPALVKASGLVAETGGRACHLAILARQLGRPCVTGLDRATILIRDGDDLLLDGDEGTLQVLARMPSQHGIEEDSLAQPSSPGSIPPGFLAVLQFGHFSGTWQRLTDTRSPGVTIALAAFPALTSLVTGDPPLETLLAHGALYARQEALATFASIAVSLLETGHLTCQPLLHSFSLCVRSLSSPVSDSSCLLDYFHAFRIVWLASVLSERALFLYQRRICDHLGASSPALLETIQRGVSCPSSSLSHGVNQIEDAIRVSNERRSHALGVLADMLDDATLQCATRLSEAICCILVILEHKHLLLRTFSQPRVNEALLYDLNLHYPDWESTLTHIATSLSLHLLQLADQRLADQRLTGVR